MNVVIPCAGVPKRMRSFGPKALIDIPNNETILSRQVRLIREIHPRSRIIVVSGFETDKLQYACDQLHVSCFYNSDYEATNVASSINIGLQHVSRREGVLIVYGDLIFNKATIAGIDRTKSCGIIDPNGANRPAEVGVTVVDDHITTFSFGLPLKWAQLTYLAPVERSLFQDVADESHRARQYTFEILNDVIDRGGMIKACEPEGAKLLEIDAAKDISRALLIT